MKKEPLKVTVFDMQPIDPPVGGGRIRLLGLYHNLGEQLPTTYIGTYDWPGPGYRKHKLSPNLTEINIPLSEEHFRVNEKWKEVAGGSNLIDTAFPLMAHLSEDYVEGVSKAVLESDVVIFSHPWVFPLLRDQIDKRKQIIVYDSQNFEGLLRTELLGDNGVGGEISREVVLAEHEICHRADVVVACSDEDCRHYEEIYGVTKDKLLVIPNGVFSNTIVPPTVEQKSAAKQKTGCQKQTAIFLGSGYEPNIEAVRFIISSVAPKLPDVSFLICGGVAKAEEFKNVGDGLPANVRMVGYIPEEEKSDYLWAADIAVNPMFSGSGTNIKMFDFMAAGLPVVTTSIGARGIDPEFHDRPTMEIADDLKFTHAIEKVLSDEFLRDCLRVTGLELVHKKFSWEKISPEYGKKIVEIYDSVDWSKRGGADVISGDDSVFDPSSPPVVNCPTPPLEQDFAIMTTWGTRCGIAEYSKYFIQALEKHNQHCTIFACLEDELDIAVPANVRKLKGNWGLHQVDPEVIVLQCQDAGLSKLIVQYHQGFFSEEILIDLTLKCILHGIDLYLTLHNTVDISSDCLRKLGDLNPWIIVHNLNEQKRLLENGFEKVLYFPMAVLDIPDESSSNSRRRLGIKGSPVIGSFGFLRPHKGVAKLVEAIAILKDLYPDIVLLGMNALYPSPDSHEYLSEIEEKIVAMGLSENILLKTDFLEIEEVVQCLHACDIIVLPYDYSSEGASASMATVVSAKRPIIATRQDVFRDFEELIYSVESNTPPVLAACIATALSNPNLLKQMQKKTVQFVQKNSWEEITRKFLNEISP
ncbi:MAG: glycosyltransferase [Desulfocapsa sp.]|nr:glycosyltransferase [Desulfocapsa sp.]